MGLAVGRPAEVPGGPVAPLGADDQQVGGVRGVREDGTGVPLGRAAVRDDVRGDVARPLVQYLARPRLMRRRRERVVSGGLARGLPPGSYGVQDRAARAGPLGGEP